ncbi:hypothetical protein JAAARDRAFT_192299 [Jaapia argillacea MUCL 33604]|uniref:Uncharacterized protein n=1 Tax=Jaapia argillacea MUCL 33604 TaxID=933084 RepID=A0A067Q8K7_9AGAM|nr:hypothetical protein JAAARDRAFT_192299 [Jaapia argillacea MUCL 33604]
MAVFFPKQLREHLYKKLHVVTSLKKLQILLAGWCYLEQFGPQLFQIYDEILSGFDEIWEGQKVIGDEEEENEGVSLQVVWLRITVQDDVEEGADKENFIPDQHANMDLPPINKKKALVRKTPANPPPRAMHPPTKKTCYERLSVRAMSIRLSTDASTDASVSVPTARPTAEEFCEGSAIG